MDCAGGGAELWVATELQQSCNRVATELRVSEAREGGRTCWGTYRRAGGEGVVGSAK